MMQKTLIIIIFVIILVLVGISILPNAVRAQTKPIYLSVDIWTSKGGKGEGSAGGSYKVGEQVVIYMLASLDCQAYLTATGPGGTSVAQLSLAGGQTQTRSLGMADQGDIGLWQVKLEASGFNQVKSDTTSFTVTGTAIPTPPSSTIIPSTPAVTPPVTSFPPPSSTTTPPPIKDGKMPITIDATTANELLALLALRVTKGQLTYDQKLDADKDGKVTMTDVRLFLKLAVKKN